MYYITSTFDFILQFRRSPHKLLLAPAASKQQAVSVNTTAAPLVEGDTEAHRVAFIGGKEQTASSKLKYQVWTRGRMLGNLSSWC